MEMKERMENAEIEMRDCLIKLENAILSLKDGKEIPTFNRLIGLKQKLSVMYGEFKKYNENNSD